MNKSSVKISLKDDLFTAYAQNIRSMIQSAADNQIKLLEVINDLFTYTVDPKTQKRIIRVNPKLTEQSLKVAVEKTRKYIMELYVKCESDFENGVKLYDAIVESKNVEILPRQIEILNDESDKLIQSVQPISEEPAFIVAKGVEDLSTKPPLTSNEKSLSEPPFSEKPLSEQSVTSIETPLSEKSLTPNEPPLSEKSLTPNEPPLSEQSLTPNEPPLSEQSLTSNEPPLTTNEKPLLTNLNIKNAQAAGKKRRTRKNKKIKY